MIKSLATAALGIAIISLSACSNSAGGYKKTADGLEYNIIKDVKEGTSPGDSDVVKLKLRIYYQETGKKDTLLFDYVKMNGDQPIEVPMNIPLQFKGDWPKGLKMLTPGDSAIFRIPVDTIIKHSQGQLPAFMKKGGFIINSVVLVSVKSAADVQQEQAKAQAEMQQKNAAQTGIDESALQEYFTKNKLSPSKTPGGVYYIIDKEGTGANAAAGQTVTVNYTGKLLDGTPFDSNVDPAFKHVEPFSFPLGQHQVIPGWEEGITMLKKGGKGRLFIPSTLAYGPQERPGLPANSILVFQVEVTDIK